MQVRLIKKYPNRRLYDTCASSYISNEDVRDLIVDGEHINIIDSKTGADITRSVLMNIIAEQEFVGGTAILTQKMLSDLIQFDDDFLAGILGIYLEQSLSFFIENQAQFRELMQNFDAENPFLTMRRLFDHQSDILSNENIGKIAP